MHGTPPSPAVQKSLLRFFMGGSVDDGKSTLIGRLLHETECGRRGRARGADARFRALRQQRTGARFCAPGRRAGGRTRTGHYHRRRPSVFFVAAARLHGRRYAGPRKLYAQYRERRLQCGSCDHSRRCAARTVAANPAARGDRPHGRRSPLCACGQQARPGELGSRGFRRHRQWFPRLCAIAQSRLAGCDSVVGA